MSPQSYRKKPVTIKAEQWNALDGWESAKRIAEWCGGKAERDEYEDNRGKTYYWSIQIPTLEGVMQARPGDFIIQGVNGEFYPCKPDIFAKTYEKESK